MIEGIALLAGQDQPALGDGVIKFLILGRIDHVDPVGQDGDRPGLEGGFVGGGVEAARQPRDDDEADPALGELDVYAGPALAIGENVDHLLGFVKPHLALYIGGMGAKGKNFYHTLATNYGYGAEADRIQELYLAGDKAAAVEAVPDELARNVSLIGPKGFVKERIAAFEEAGATVLNVVPIAEDAAGRVQQVELLRGLL